MLPLGPRWKLWKVDGKELIQRVSRQSSGFSYLGRREWEEQISNRYQRFLHRYLGEAVRSSRGRRHLASECEGISASEFGGDEVEVALPDSNRKKKHNWYCKTSYARTTGWVSWHPSGGVEQLLLGSARPSQWIKSVPPSAVWNCCICSIFTVAEVAPALGEGY